MSTPIPSQLCQGCGGPLPQVKATQTVHPRAKWCSDECKSAQRRRSSPVVATGTQGAISELLVSIDLMRRGLPVFRALSQACMCDLMVVVEGRPLRIEVRTGSLSDTNPGRMWTSVSDRDAGRFDVLAVVAGLTILYLPDLFGANEPGMHLSPAAASRLVAWGIVSSP
jgi:hypothetical protein